MRVLNYYLKIIHVYRGQSVDYNTFCQEQDKTIAKNLLLDKMCDSCDWLHGGDMTCGWEKNRFRDFTLTTKPLPQTRTCSYWKDRYS